MDKKVSWGRRTPLLTFVAAVVVLAFLWLSLGHHLRQKRQDDLAQARRDVSNIAVALAEQVSRLFTGADQVMRLMQADYRRDPAQFDLAAWVARSTSLAPIAKAVNLFDEHGVLVVSSRPDKRPGSARIDDRAEFIALARGDRGLVVGRTYPGRVSPGMVLPLFRRLEDSAGHFRGVLSVSLDPDYLARQFASLDVGADGSLALFGLDGYVRARTPIVPGMYERDVLELPSRVRVFGELRSRPAGTYRLESAFDMRLRLFGYRAVDGLPLVLSIGRSEAEVLAPFRHETLLIVCFGSIASLAILALSSTWRETAPTAARASAPSPRPKRASVACSRARPMRFSCTASHPMARFRSIASTRRQPRRERSTKHPAAESFARFCRRMSSKTPRRTLIGFSLRARLCASVAMRPRVWKTVRSSSCPCAARTTRSTGSSSTFATSAICASTRRRSPRARLATACSPRRRAT